MPKLTAAVRARRAFMEQYHLECRAGRECLLTRGVPVTTLYRTPATEGDAGAAIAETTSAIITCLDRLELGDHAVDQVQPALKEVSESLAKVPHLPADFPALLCLHKWSVLPTLPPFPPPAPPQSLSSGALNPALTHVRLLELNAMRAAATVDADSIRQLTFDLNALYTSFIDFLRRPKARP